jgi:hypothetical protein
MPRDRRRRDFFPNTNCARFFVRRARWWKCSIQEEDEGDQSIEKGKEKKTSSVIAIGGERRNIGDGGHRKIFISCDDHLTPLKDEKGADDPRDHKDRRADSVQPASSRVPLASFIHLQLVASAAAIVLEEHHARLRSMVMSILRASTERSVAS